MLQSAVVPSASPMVMPVAISEVVARSEPISKRLINDSSFNRRIRRASDQFRQDRTVLSDSHPTCRLIASLFGPLQAHQRPGSDDACEAMARIKFLAQLMQQAREGVKDLPSGFIANSITARSLANIFFPSNLATWSELLNQSIKDGLEGLVLVEIDRLVGGDFVSYLDQQIDTNISIRTAVERDFQFSLKLITKRVIDVFELDWLESQHQSPDPELIWPVIYQWVNGEEVIPIPSSVNCQRIDWKQITELNYRMVESIVAQQSSAQQPTVAQPISPTTPQANQSGQQVNPTAQKAEQTATKQPIAQAATKIDPFAPNLEVNAVELGVAEAKPQVVVKNDAGQAVAVEDIAKVSSQSSAAALAENKPRGSAEPSLTNQYEQTIKATELFSDPVQPAGRRLPGSNAQSCDIRSANDPQLSNLLEQLIDDCRAFQGMLSLLRIRAVSSESGEVIQSGVSKLLEWQAVAYKSLKLNCTSPFGAAYLNSDGDFSIVFQDLDRIQTSRLVRSTILPQEFNVAKSSRTSERCGLVCGVATVSRPTRAFCFEQLAEAAERCLQGAMLQGRGAIKSLEVF